MSDIFQQLSAIPLPSQHELEMDWLEVSGAAFAKFVLDLLEPDFAGPANGHAANPSHEAKRQLELVLEILAGRQDTPYELIAMEFVNSFGVGECLLERKANDVMAFAGWIIEGMEPSSILAGGIKPVLIQTSQKKLRWNLEASFIAGFEGELMKNGEINLPKSASKLRFIPSEYKLEPDEVAPAVARLLLPPFPELSKFREWSSNEQGFDDILAALKDLIHFDHSGFSRQMSTGKPRSGRAKQ